MSPGPATPAGHRSTLAMRPVVLGAFVPALIFEVGVGAMLPVVPLSATGLGAHPGMAGFIAALVPIGKIAGDLPAGRLASWLGDRAAMAVAGLVAAIAFSAAALAPSLLLLGASIFLVGSASSVFSLARHSFLTAITPPLQRARVMSTLGGVHRIGLFIGPFAGAGVIHFSAVRGSFWLATATALLAIGVLAFAGEEGTGASRQPGKAAGMRSGGKPWQVLVEYRRLFASLGLAVLLVGASRGARQTVLPLWMELQGFDAEVTSIIFGVAGAVDMLLFYPAGKVMDRFGRLWIALPSMVVMAIAMGLLPLTHTTGAVTAAAIVLGVGNGMGSGILMTLGADVAPDQNRAPFLAVWRLFQDTGEAGGPLVLSAGAALGSLAAGIWVAGAMAAGAAVALGRWVPRWTPHATSTTRRLAGL